MNSQQSQLALQSMEDHMMDGGQVKVWRFKIFDISIDEYRTSTRWAVKEFITGQLHGETVGESESIERKYLINQLMTVKDFDVSNPQMPTTNDTF